MHRLWLAFAALLAGPVVVAAATPEPTPRRNVLLLIADDLGLQLGCYGDRAAHTPHLDALARSGTRFTHAFASVSSCSPSRATILTGLPTHQCGQYGLAHGPHNAYSFRTVKSLPALLAPAGYRCGAIAKLHVQPRDVYPFDVEVSANGRNSLAIADAVRKFLQETGDKPFFLLVGFTDPHRSPKGFGNEQKYPAEVPARRFDPHTLPMPDHLPDSPEVRAELAEYYQSVTRLDDGVGRVLKALEDSGRDEQTLVIFLSDNGIPFPGAKTTLYDPGIRLPLIIRRPGQKPGQTCQALVSFTDIVPTVLDWCGVRPTFGKSAVPRGRSLLPILEQPDPSGWDEVYASHQFHEITMYYPMRMIRTRDHKLILNLAYPLEYPIAADIGQSATWQGVLKRGDGKLGRRELRAFLHRPRVELYDLRADPHETKNVAGDPRYGKVLEELMVKLTAWRTATEDPWLVSDRSPGPPPGP